MAGMIRGNMHGSTGTSHHLTRAQHHLTRTTHSMEAKKIKFAECQKNQITIAVCGKNYIDKIKDQ